MQGLEKSFPRYSSSFEGSRWVAGVEYSGVSGLDGGPMSISDGSTGLRLNRLARNSHSGRDILPISYLAPNKESSYTIHMNSLDLDIFSFFQSIHTPFLTYGFYAATWFFNTIPFIILVLVSIYFLHTYSTRRRVFEFFIAISLSVWLVWFLKYSIAHPRPDFSIITAYGPSFPSAHTALATTYFLFFLRFMRTQKDLFRKYVHQVFCVLAPLTVGMSRLYLGVHWLSDVLAGFCIGIGALLVAHTLWNNKRRLIFFRVR